MDLENLGQRIFEHQKPPKNEGLNRLNKTKKNTNPLISEDSGRCLGNMRRREKFGILASQPNHGLTREAGLDEGSEEHLPEFGEFPLEEPWLGGRHRVVAPGPVGLMVPVRDGWNRFGANKEFGETRQLFFFLKWV